MINRKLNLRETVRGFLSDHLTQLVKFTRLAAVLRDAGRVALLDSRLGVLRLAVLQGEKLAHGVCPPRQLGSGRGRL